MATILVITPSPHVPGAVEHLEVSGVSRYVVGESNGVLTAYFDDESKTVYAPGAWHSVAEEPAEPGGVG